MATREELEAQLAAWEALAAKATPGPWEDAAGSVCVKRLGTADYEWANEAAPFEVRERDAAFIAMARDAVPALIGALRNAQAEVADLRAQLATAQAVCDAAVAHERGETAPAIAAVTAAWHALGEAIEHVAECEHCGAGRDEPHGGACVVRAMTEAVEALRARGGA